VFCRFLESMSGERVKSKGKVCELSEERVRERYRKGYIDRGGVSVFAFFETRMCLGFYMRVSSMA
jgi:hypothetical protein